MSAKQNPNVLATFAAILVAIFFCYGDQNGHSSDRCCLVMFNVMFWNVCSLL